jgi:hypothetical protein
MVFATPLAGANHRSSILRRHTQHLMPTPRIADASLSSFGRATSLDGGMVVVLNCSRRLGSCTAFIRHGKFPSHARHFPASAISQGGSCNELRNQSIGRFRTDTTTIGEK